jgi:hypothetical protein
MTTHELWGNVDGGRYSYNDSLHQLAINPNNGDTIELHNLKFSSNHKDHVMSLIKHIKVPGRSNIHIEFYDCYGTGVFLYAATEYNLPISKITVNGCDAEDFKRLLIGLKAFVDGSDSNLQCLRFHNIKIKSPEFAFLRSFMGNAQALEELTMSKITSFSNGGMVSLFERLGWMKCLQRVHFETNNCALPHCVDLIENQALQVIEIHMLSGLSDHGLISIANLITSSSALRECTMSIRVGAHQSTWNGLAQSFVHHCPTLQKLHLNLFVDKGLTPPYRVYCNESGLPLPVDIFDYKRGIQIFCKAVKKRSFCISPRLDFNLVLFDKRKGKGHGQPSCRTYYQLQNDLLLSQTIRPIMCSTPKYNTVWPQLIARINKPNKEKLCSGANVLYSLIRFEAFSELLVLGQGTLYHATTSQNTISPCSVLSSSINMENQNNSAKENPSSRKLNGRKKRKI